MGDEFNLRSALAILRTRWRTIVVTVLVAVAAVLALAVAQAPRYESTAVLLAGQGQGIAGVDSVLEVNQATQSLGTLITDRVVVEDAAREVGYEGDIEQLLGRVTADVPANTQAIELTVSDTSATRAAELANAIADRFSRLIEQKASKGSTLSAVIWQPAVAASHPSSTSPLQLAMTALVLSLLLGIGLAFIREQLDGRWRSVADVERALGLPVLGGVPDVSRRPARRKVYG